MADLLSFDVLIPWILGMLFGLFVGATPGLTATMAVALIVPVTFYLPDPNTSLAMIIGVSFTAIFAGDIPATFLRIPGTPASAAATLDGHEMAKRGRAGFALTLDLFCSSLGGLIGVSLLILLAPQLARFALRFSNFEYFWLALAGLSLSAAASMGTVRQGWIAAILGLLFSTVGIDMVSGAQRFTFGQSNLLSGLGFIPAMIGLFGLSEVIRNIAKAGDRSTPMTTGSTALAPIAALCAIWRHKWSVLKSSVLGTLIGALPGAGADIAAWGAYGVAQKTSRNSAAFGQGTEEGVIAPTSANNAAIGGAWIPALVFGIPGDAVTAIVLGAMLMYDIKPGPMIFETSADQVRSIFNIALITQLLLLPCGYLAIKMFGLILRLRRGVVLTGVAVFSVVGAYAINNDLFDVYVMVMFGLIGWYLESQKVPLGPLILGLILGPMVEENLRTGLIKTEGNFLPFLTRPLCALLVFLMAVALVGPWLWRRWRKIAATDLVHRR